MLKEMVHMYKRILSKWLFKIRYMEGNEGLYVYI